MIPITTVLPVVGLGIDSRWMCDSTMPNSRGAASACEVSDTERREDSNVSVAGEEDPGAALDLIAPSTDAPGACCPWPSERSA